MKKVYLLIILVLTLNGCSVLDGRMEFVPNLDAPILVVDVYKPDDPVNGFVVLRDSKGNVYQGHFMASSMSRVIADKYQKGDTLFVSK